jgi:hypothetical protein
MEYKVIAKAKAKAMFLSNKAVQFSRYFCWLLLIPEDNKRENNVSVMTMYKAI